MVPPVMLDHEELQDLQDHKENVEIEVMAVLVFQEHQDNKVPQDPEALMVYVV